MCGRNPIAEPADIFDESRLNTEELNLLVDVFTTYGKYTSSELITMTHIPGGPWYSVYEEKKNHQITQRSMADYFNGSNELNEFRPTGEST